MDSSPRELTSRFLNEFCMSLKSWRKIERRWRKRKKLSFFFFFRLGETRSWKWHFGNSILNWLYRLHQHCGRPNYPLLLCWNSHQSSGMNTPLRSPFNQICWSENTPAHKETIDARLMSTKEESWQGRRSARAEWWRGRVKKEWRGKQGEDGRCYFFFSFLFF